jgi:hypothetical protein
MPRVCSVCRHAARVAIDNGLETGQSLRDIAAQFGFSKSAVDRHKVSHLPAALAQDGADLQAEFQAARQADRWHYTQLRKHARAAVKAFEGWGSIRSPEDWQAACEDAGKRYQSGRFLLERLGAERFLDPQLMATLSQLHQDLKEEYATDSPTATMVIDLAVMAYYNALRVQGWIGDLALVIEQELFAEDALKVTLRQRYGTQVEGFAVEAHLQHLKEQLLPLCERVNRQLLQNLQALQRPRPASSPMVAIGRAASVNIARQQLNIHRKDGRSSQPVDPRRMADGSRPRPPLACQRSRRGHRSPATQIDG